MSLNQYMKEANKYPVLSREEEMETALAYKQGSKRARQKLICSNLRFVMRRAHKYSGYVNGRGITLSDLVQQGNMGLMRAVDKFDPSKGYRLISYAVWWIDAMIKGYILHSFNVIKYGTTQAEKTLFFRSGEIMDKLWQAEMNGEDMELYRKALAKEYKVKLSEFLSFERRMNEFESSMDASRGDDVTLHELVGYPPPQEEEVERNNIQTIVREAVNNTDLSPREIEIVRGQYLADNHHTLQSMGDRFGVSRERTRQIRNDALKKIRRRFDAQGITAQCVGVVA